MNRKDIRQIKDWDYPTYKKAKKNYERAQKKKYRAQRRAERLNKRPGALIYIRGCSFIAWSILAVIVFALLMSWLW